MPKLTSQFKGIPLLGQCAVLVNRMIRKWGSCRPEAKNALELMSPQRRAFTSIDVIDDCRSTVRTSTRP